MSRLANKVAIVSGGSTAIAQNTAARFAAEGATIVLADREANVSAEFVAVLGPRSTVLPLDVTSYESWRHTVDATVARFGRLDILVHCASMVERGTVEETTFRLWRELFAVNVDGVFFGCQNALRAMRAQGGGSIVNVSSIYGLKGDPDSAAFSAAAGAVRALTKEVAVYCARKGYGIRCNSIHVGSIGAPSVDVPIGRPGTAEDVTAAIVFLASDESSFVTGAEYVVDGGVTA